MKKPTVRKEDQAFAKRTRAYDAIFSFLSRYPNDSFSLSEIAKKAGVSKSTASRVLTDMHAQTLITIEEIANLWRVRFNTKSLQAIGFKISANLARIYQSRVIEPIISEYGVPRSIILFGSYRKGEDGPGSDIDIAIETGHEKELEIVTLDLKKGEWAKYVKDWETQNERKFKLHFFSRKKIDRNLFINIANGIVLYGLLEVNP